MKQDIHALAQRLKRVPAGTVQIISESGCVPRQAQTKGKGIIEPYAVFDGVMLEYNCFQGGSVRFTHRPLPHVLEINYCHQGRVGWDMKSGSTVYLGAGDLAMQPMDCCADSLMRFPSGWYMGIQITVDFSAISPRLSAILERNGIQIPAAAVQQQRIGHIALRRTHRHCKGRGRDLRHLIAAVAQGFGLTDQARPGKRHADRQPLFHRASISPFLHQIKIMELFAYLAELDPTQQKAVSEWNTEQTAIIQQMHDFLIDHVQQRYTIEELSHRFLINTSTLKSAFKAVYGMPIAAYMKEYRMQQAMIMLQDPALSIAEIAARLGYESQSKFARAFKDCAGILPRDYRKTLQTKQ